MSPRLPRLILNGFALSNPFVGQGAYTLRLVQALERHANDQFLIILPHKAAIPDEAKNASLLRLPRLLAPKHQLLRQAFYNNQLLCFVRKQFPNSVFHSPGPIAGRPSPLRTVVTIHDCIYRSFPNYLGRFVLRRLYLLATERFARRARLVLTSSNFSKSELVEKVRIAPDKIEILYPWVGNEFLNRISQDRILDIRRRYSLPERFWLYIGGYDYRKNVETLVRAYAKIASNKLLPPLVLAGAVPRTASRVRCDILGTLRSVSLSDRQVILPGVIASSDLPALYKAADLLIYPSLMEGFGLPPAEAMAVDTPVLSSNSSSLPEVVQNPNCLFNPRNEEDLAARLDEAARDTRQFLSPLSEKFTEPFGIKRYLDLIGCLSSG
jgi:glycosyltransferase involved in cell wall biosynthesis